MRSESWEARTYTTLQYSPSHPQPPALRAQVKPQNSPSLADGQRCPGKRHRREVFRRPSAIGRSRGKKKNTTDDMMLAWFQQDFLAIRSKMGNFCHRGTQNG